MLADCPISTKAAKAARVAIFSTGRNVFRGSRLLVEESIKDRMLEKIAAVGKYMKPGDPLDPATKLGAIVDEIQIERVLGYIRRGQERGDRCVRRFRACDRVGRVLVEPTCSNA